MDMPTATATPTIVNATVIPDGASGTCAMARAVPVGVLQKMPAAVAAHPYASQMYIAMVLSEMNAPVPMDMNIDEDLTLLRKVLRETQPGDWYAPPTPTRCCCLCVASRFTVHPKRGQQYAMTGSRTAVCLYVLPCPCLNATYSGAIEEGGTSYAQTMSSCISQDTFQGTLTSVDSHALTVSYALTGKIVSRSFQDRVNGVQTINAKAGTNIIQYTSGSWAGMVLRHKKVTM